MCSFLGIITDSTDLLDKIEDNQNTLFKKLKYRGPDIQNFTRINKKTLFAGFVLAINSEVAQPIEKDGSWLLWNGEIYEYPKNYINDTEYLINYFNDDGLSKIFSAEDSLDGEYAICFYKEDLLYLITDDFFTKPLCYSITEDTIVFSSYESAIREIMPNAVIHNALPNTCYIIDTKNYSLVSKKEIYKWDFEPRYQTFDLWSKAYVEAIKKRCNTDKKLFLPLSSGYDSGGICCEVLEHDVACTMYSYLGIENQQILADRRQRIQEKGNEHIILDPSVYFEDNFKVFVEKVENWIAYHYDGKPYLDVYHAYSCFAHFLICEHAKATGHTICLSGHGADEIYSDYYSPRTNSVSVVKGDYRGWRKKWPNFDMGYGRNILGMFDRTAGACGIETRYPYLDRKAVQNFLWLTDDLKNKHYKQCQHQIMKKRNFPFDDVNLKVGLRIFKNDKNNDLFRRCLKDFYQKYNLSRPSWIKGY